VQTQLEQGRKKNDGVDEDVGVESGWKAGTIYAASEDKQYGMEERHYAARVGRE
jgi:hypothetical protein